MSVGPAPKMISDRLEPGERLTWWSKPRPGILLRKVDAFLIPFSPAFTLSSDDFITRLSSLSKCAQ